MVLSVVNDWRQLSNANRIVQEDNRELRATVDVQTVRIHELETNVLEERNRVKALHEQFQEANHRLSRVVQEVKDRTERMMAECVTLVEQIVDGKILDEGQENANPSTEDEIESTEVVETSDPANH